MAAAVAKAPEKSNVRQVLCNSSFHSDIRIKLILYYQTLYTTEVANNTEFKERSFFFNVLLFFPLPPKKVQYKTIV